jgi:hypothetical protein
MLYFSGKQLFKGDVDPLLLHILIRHTHNKVSPGDKMPARDFKCKALLCKW